MLLFLLQSVLELTVSYFAGLYSTLHYCYSESQEALDLADNYL